MPTKIRLQRKGKKGQPFYHLVVADGRAPRDGKFIERIGTYNPMTHSATIEINFDRSLYWVQIGAQPTDTARSILSNKGVMLKHHLLKGVKKGAHTEEQAEEKFQEWLKDKQEKLEQERKDSELSEKDKTKKRLEEERKINEARAAELSKKRAKENLQAEEASQTKADAEVKEEKPEPKTEEPKSEEPKKEEPKSEEPKAEEPKVEEPKKEEPKAEEPKTKKSENKDE